jgi:hypothetical protein
VCLIPAVFGGVCAQKFGGKDMAHPLLAFDIADIGRLLKENETLIVEFNAWHERFPNSPAYHAPLNPIWLQAEREQPEDRAALSHWYRHLIAYLVALRGYYAAVLEKPDKLASFHLMDLIANAGGFAASHTVKGEHCPVVLDAHRQLLLIEQKKQADAWHFTFRQLLWEAMSHANDKIDGAAAEMGIDRGTLGDYLAGRTEDLRAPTKIKMGKYVKDHHPTAKQQIKQLGL